MTKRNPEFAASVTSNILPLNGSADDTLHIKTGMLMGPYLLWLSGQGVQKVHLAGRWFMPSEARPRNLVQFSLQGKQTYSYFHCNHKEGWNLPRECNIFDSLTWQPRLTPVNSLSAVQWIQVCNNTKAFGKGTQKTVFLARANLSHILPACIKSI